MNLSNSPEYVPASGKRRRAELSRQILISLAAMLATVGVVLLVGVPNPSILLMTGLAVFTSLYGYPAGITCALVTLGYSMYSFSTDHSFTLYTPQGLQKLAVVVLCAVLSTLFIGELNRQNREAARKLQALSRHLRKDSLSPEEAQLVDAVTGLRNRYALRRDYNRFDNRYLHVMMLDLDDFKRFNDRYGHPMGDRVLEKVGWVLVECFGEACCYRYSDDEFLVVNGDLEESVFLARMNDVKERLLNARVGDRDQVIPIHFSAGYVYGGCEMSFDLRLMLHQADLSLYEAKGMGKDCYVGREFVRSEARFSDYAGEDH